MRDYNYEGLYTINAYQLNTQPKISTVSLISAVRLGLIYPTKPNNCIDSVSEKKLVAGGIRFA